MEQSVNVVVLGGGGVGKSALVTRIIDNKFSERYDPTIEEQQKCKFNVDGVTVTLNILDTAGQEEYSALQDSWFRFGHAFILTYSITDSHSYDDLNVLRRKLLRQRGADKPAIV